jgi:hypothetical protein
MQKRGYFLLWVVLCQISLTQEITFTIKNDSEHTVLLHTGKATVSIQSNTSYKFTKPVGTQIYLMEFGEKKTLLLTVKESFEGKKINLSDLLKKE